MDTTYYMELLAANQPWSLLVFLAVPVILVETVAVTELYMLHTNRYVGAVRQVNAVAAVAGGAYSLAVALYLLVTVAIPVIRAEDCRCSAELVAVGSYLFGVVPLLGVALVELGVFRNRRRPQARVDLQGGLAAPSPATVAMISRILEPAGFGAGTGQNESHYVGAQHDMSDAAR